MKKIAIMLLAALMLFAFVACDPDAEETKLSTVATPMTGELTEDPDGVDLTISDIQSDVKIAEDGKVTGTIKYYDNAAFNTALGFNAASRYFFAVEFEVEEGQTIYVSGDEDAENTQTEWILDVSNKTEETFVVKTGTSKDTATELITLDFSGATFEDAN